MVTYLLNSAVLTAFGDYRYAEVSEETARGVLAAGGYVSAIGHAPTAEVLSERLGFPVPFDRRSITMAPGDRALVFRPQSRLPEGVTLTTAEARAIPCEFGLLERLV